MQPTGSIWLFLILAGIFEIGWPLGFKLSQLYPSWRVWGIVISIIAMTASGGLLWLAQKGIPLGTAYAVWTGIGAVGTFTVGVVFFNDPAGWVRVSCILLIVLGIIGLKIAG